MAQELDSKSADILKYLITLTRPVSAEIVGVNLGLTQRAVYYRIPKISAWLDDYDLCLISKPNFGLFIEGCPNKKRQISELIPGNIFFSKGQREYLIGFQLLTAKKPVIIKELIYKLSVSRSTVSKNMDNIRFWLKDYGLTLKSKPNYGFWIEGEEKDIREAILSCLISGSHEFGIQNDLMRFVFADPGMDIGRDYFGNLINQYFLEIDRSYLNNILNAIIDVSLSDRAQYILLLRLAILIKRLIYGNEIPEICPGLGDLKHLHEYYWSEFIAGRFSDYFKILIGLGEISYITRYVLDAQSVRPVILEENPEITGCDGLNNEISISVERFLSTVSRRLHPALITDGELRDNLVLHLKYAHDRMDVEHIADNPVIQDIKKEYARIYFLVEDCLEGERMGNLTLCQDEIGYITIHIAAAIERLRYKERTNKRVLLVCNAGMASALLLKSRIQSEFSNVTIMDMISYRELLNRNDFSDIDMIISTIPLNLRNAPMVLVVNVLLKEQDVENLKKTLALEKPNGHLPRINIEEGPRLISLIDNSLISLRQQARDWKESTEIVGGLLFKNKIVEYRYIESMKNVVSEFGPYMVEWPGIAMLHSSCGAGAIYPGISIVTLEKPVCFGHLENDPVDIVTALSIPAGFSMPLALEQLNDLFLCDEAVEAIRKASRRSTVLMWIKRFGQEEKTSYY